MIKRTLFFFVAMNAIIFSAAQAANPMSRLDHLVGKWNCTYDSGSQQSSYSASFAFTQGGKWLRETDAWPGGGDEALMTYVPATRTWITMVADSGRGATTFQAKETGTTTLVYHSVYPNSAMTVTYRFVSATRFDVHAAIAGAHPSTNADACTKT